MSEARSPSAAIRLELAQLRKEQAEALKKARFVPMSTVESAKYDARRTKIMALMQTLQALREEDKKA